MKQGPSWMDVWTGRQRNRRSGKAKWGRLLCNHLEQGHWRGDHFQNSIQNIILSREKLFKIFQNIIFSKNLSSRSQNIIMSIVGCSIPHPPGNIQTQSWHLSVEFYIFSHNPSIHKMRCNLVKARRVTGKPVARGRSNIHGRQTKSLQLITHGRAKLV